MADVKISNLPAATTPVDGTEVFPLVQSSTTKKLALSNLIVGGVRSNATTGVLNVAGPTAGTTRVMTTPDANFTAARTDAANSFTGDQTLSTGNLIQGTAGKGFNFTANTPAAGMTSELLNWYEEGTWTPSVTASAGALTTVGAVSGSYTRVGRAVHCFFNIAITTNGTGSASILVANIPFAPAASNTSMGVFREQDVNGKMGSVNLPNTTQLQLQFYDNTYPASDGCRFVGQITYYV